MTPEEEMAWLATYRLLKSNGVDVTRNCGVGVWLDIAAARSSHGQNRINLYEYICVELARRYCDDER